MTQPIAEAGGVGTLQIARQHHRTLEVLLRNNDPIAFHQNSTLKAHQDRGDLIGQVLHLQARLTDVTRERDGERDARHKADCVLRDRDAAMQTLFDRLRAHGDNCEDLIP